MTTTSDTEPIAAPDTGGAIGVKIGDEQLVLRPAMLGHAPAQALRLQSHGAWRLPTLIDAVNGGVGPEELAGLVFLARRQAGQSATYDQVVAALDKIAATGGTVAIVYDQASAAIEAAVATSAVIIDFTFVPEADSPEA